MKIDPRLEKFLRFGLIGCGAMSVVSAIVGIIGAYQLIEPSDEQSVGVTPFDFAGFYLVMLLGGLGMIWFGLRQRK